MSDAPSVRERHVRRLELAVLRASRLAAQWQRLCETPGRFEVTRLHAAQLRDALNRANPDDATT